MDVEHSGVIFDEEEGNMRGQQRRTRAGRMWHNWTEDYLPWHYRAHR